MTTCADYREDLIGTGGITALALAKLELLQGGKGKDMIKRLLAAVALIVSGSAVAAATCNTTQTSFTIGAATAAQCVSNDNDAGGGGFFATNPTVFGLSGWTLGDKNDGGGNGNITFNSAPINGVKSGSFTVTNPSVLTYGVALKAGNGFGFFLMGTQGPGPFTWSSGKDLSHASIWYIPGTPPPPGPNPVPLPAGGLLLLTGLGALAFKRRRA